MQRIQSCSLLENARSSSHFRSLTIFGSLILGLCTVLAASPAAASVPDVFAFAYNDNPTPPPPPGVVLPLAYQGGSSRTTCPGTVATVAGIGTGKYMVTFPCSASPNGIVHVTAVDGNARYCEIENWTDSGSAKVVIVLCFKGPVPDNSKFTVTYTTSSGPLIGGAHAYVFSDPSGVPLASYNSAGPAITITHGPTGRWTVKLPGLSTGSYDGDLQATAVHPNDAPRRCHIDNWFISGSDYEVPISCTNSNGVLTDTWFTVSYHFKRSVFGTVPPAVAYMTNLSGAPPGSDYNSAGLPNSFVASPSCGYTMEYPGVGTGATHMQVTALGGTAGYYCQLENIWTISGGDVKAPVICFNNVGSCTSNLLFSTFASH
jgi:hypothetical protein